MKTEAELDKLDEIVNDIIEHQNSPEKHPLTCGNDSNHRPFIPIIRNEEIILICADCIYTQSYIPTIFNTNI